jgi:hypothetical protein
MSRACALRGVGAPIAELGPDYKREENSKRQTFHLGCTSHQPTRGNGPQPRRPLELHVLEQIAFRVGRIPVATSIEERSQLEALKMLMKQLRVFAIAT